MVRLCGLRKSTILVSGDSFRVTATYNGSKGSVKADKKNIGLVVNQWFADKDTIVVCNGMSGK